MSRSANYFKALGDKSAGYTGFVDAAHKWGLPGIDHCHVCKKTWAGACKAYPSVDLTLLAERAAFEKPRAEPIEEYERLCDLVQPFLPPHAVLEPGASFGPLVGEAEGHFGQFVSNYGDLILIRREALDRLLTRPLQGLKGCRLEVRYLEPNSPELLELEILPKGRAHPVCLPPYRTGECPRCGYEGLSVPKELVLDRATLPLDLDVFRLEHLSSVVVCTERFVEACRELGLDGLAFTPLPVR